LGTSAVNRGELLFVGRGDLEHREEGFLRNIDLADALHAALAFFLFFEQLAFARDVPAVAFGENVFENRRSILYSANDERQRNPLGASYRRSARSTIITIRFLAALDS
jgi:hypothetical protein